MRESRSGRFAARSVAALVLVAAHSALGGDPPDFDKAIARCHELVNAERFADGERALRALFTDFAGDVRVRARLTEIEEDLKVCLFRRSTPAPTGKDLFGTACEQFNASTRAVSLDYYEPHGAFWPKGDGGGLRIFSVPFEGDVTIEFSTDWVNKDKTVVSALLCWDAERGSGYECFPGYFRVESNFDPPPPGQSALPDRVFTFERAIVRVKDGVETKLFEKPPEQQRFTSTGGHVTASRSGNRITLRMADATVATAADATFTSGCVGIRSENPYAIRIKGRVDATWLRTLVGQKLAAKFAAWQKSSYDREKEIPAWALVETPVLPDSALGELPSDAPPGSANVLGDLAPRSIAGDPAAAKDAEDAAANAPGATALYLRALACVARRQYGGAVRLLGELSVADPGFVTGRLMAAYCKLRLLRLERAKADLAFVLKSRPRWEYAHQLAVSIAIYEQDYAAADVLLAAAANNGVPDEALAWWRNMLDRARTGPILAQRFEVSTAHFVVVSDHSKELCASTAAELEAMRPRYCAVLGVTAPPGPKPRVFVFAGRKSLDEYLRDLQLTPNSTFGLCVTSSRALLLCASDDTAAYAKTLRHEGFHWFLHGFLDDAPLWLEEGCAAFMESGGAGAAAASEAEPALRARFLPLRRLLALTRLEFQAQSEVCCPEARCLIALLQSTTEPKLSSLLPDYVTALRDGLSQDEAAAKVFEPVADLLQSEFSRAR